MTGETLPTSLAGMQKYAESVDLADEANRELIEGLSSLSPELREMYVLWEGIGVAMRETNVAAIDLVAIQAGRTIGLWDEKAQVDSGNLFL